MTLSLLPQNNSANHKKDEKEGVEDTTLHVLVPLKINSKLNRFLLGLPDRIQGFSCLTFHGVGDMINGTNSYLARCLQTTEVRNLSIHFASSQFTERNRETLLLGISRPGSMSQDIVWCNGSQWLEVSHLPTFPPLSIPPSSILSWGYLWNIEVPKPNQDHLNPLFNIQMLFENLVSRSVGALSNWGPYPLYKIVSSMVFCWNPTLAKRFDKAKEMFVNQEERLSFHGTNRESAERILEFGFNEKLVKRTYHGEAGVYTTDLFDKAFQFCKRHNGAVLICRVLLGSSHIRSEHTDMSGIKITADSVLVPRDNKVFSRQTLPTGAYFQAGLRSADQALPIGVLYINSFDEMK